MLTWRWLSPTFLTPAIRREGGGGLPWSLSADRGRGFDVLLFGGAMGGEGRLCAVAWRSWGDEGGLIAPL